MTKSNPLEVVSCLSRREFPIEAIAGGSFRIGIPVCRNEDCRFRLFASDLGLQVDKRGLFLMPESDVRTESEARAYLAAWRFFARNFLSERKLWEEALGF
jgi:hypothetical protein